MKAKILAISMVSCFVAGCAGDKSVTIHEVYFGEIDHDGFLLVLDIAPTDACILGEFSNQGEMRFAVSRWKKNKFDKKLVSELYINTGKTKEKLGELYPMDRHKGVVEYQYNAKTTTLKDVSKTDPPLEWVHTSQGVEPEELYNPKTTLALQVDGDIKRVAYATMEEARPAIEAYNQCLKRHHIPIHKD